MNIPYKLVLWDWLGTLFCDNYFYEIYILDLMNRGKIPSDYDFNCLDFQSSLNLKSKLKEYDGTKIPTTWWLVDRFTEIGVAQIIVSNGLRRFIEKELYEYNPFDLILTSEKFEPKPAIDMPLEAIKYCGIENKDEVLFIGDTLTDQNTARQFGVRFFRIEEYYYSVYEIAKTLGFI